MCGCTQSCDCSTPITIPNGTNGTNGINGLFGGWSQKFIFDTTTSASPLATKIRLNNVAPASVTEIYVNDLNSDSVDVDAFLDAFSNDSAYGLIKLWKQFDSSIFWMGKVTGVTDNGADHTLTVEYTGHNGTFTNTDNIVLSFTANGDNGVTYFEGTYAEITALVGTLVPGGTYILTDYETKHIVEGTGIRNVDTPGYVTKIESLKLTAKDASSFYHKAQSLSNISDDLLYDFTLNTIGGQSRTGLIYWRKINTNDVEAWFDVRNQIVARYNLDLTGIQWTSDPIDKGMIKSNFGVMYYSIRDGASISNYRLVEDVTILDQNLHTNLTATVGINSLSPLVSSLTYHESIDIITSKAVKVGFGCKDVLITDTATNIEVGETCVGISIVNSTDVFVGGKTTKAIVQECFSVKIGNRCSNLYLYTTDTLEIGDKSNKSLFITADKSKVSSEATSLFLMNAIETKIGAGCNTLFFIRESNQNVVSNNCSGISLGNSSTNNFAQSCSDIEIYSGGNNRFAQNCNTINLIGELDNAYTGVNVNGLGLDYYSPYSQMEHNTFGTGCSNITFTILGGRGNQFGDECKNLLFTKGDYSENWRLVGCYFVRGIQNKTFQAIIHGVSFLVPNQVTTTVTENDWYSQVLWFNDNEASLSGVDEEYATSSSLYGTTNKIMFGFESINLPTFTPGDVDVLGRGTSPGTDLTTADVRTSHITCLAWMWTPEGYPLSMTLAPAMGPLLDPTPSLNR